MHNRVSSIYAGAVRCGGRSAFNDENVSNKLIIFFYLTASAYFVDAIAHALASESQRLFSAFLINPLNPRAFCQKGVSWTFWCFLGSISVKLPLIRSKMPLHHNSLAFSPPASQCATFCLGHAQKSKF